tara:strand:+ start:491 stop:700 length:210 start_codon:yes stop_codon:yes gene_type:complete
MSAVTMAKWMSPTDSVTYVDADSDFKGSKPFRQATAQFLIENVKIDSVAQGCLIKGISLSVDQSSPIWA